MSGFDEKHRPWILTIALLFLSLAVCNWGLQYKMSLYGSDHSAPKTSVAKLWTGSKDGSASAVPIPEKQSPALEITLFFTVLTVLLSSCRYVFIRLQHASIEWKLRLAVVQRAYFFRPPPVFA